MSKSERTKISLKDLTQDFSNQGDWRARYDVLLNGQSVAWPTTPPFTQKDVDIQMALYQMGLKLPKKRAR